MKSLTVYVLVVVILLLSLRVSGGSDDENGGHISTEWDSFPFDSNAFDEPIEVSAKQTSSTEQVNESPEQFRHFLSSSNGLERQDLLEDFRNVFDQQESTDISLMNNQPQQSMRRKRPRHELEDTESQSESTLIPNDIPDDDGEDRDIPRKVDPMRVNNRIASIERLVKRWNGDPDHPGTIPYKNLSPKNSLVSEKYLSLIAVIVGAVERAGGVRQMLNQVPGAWDCIHSAKDSNNCLRKCIVAYRKIHTPKSAALHFFKYVVDNWKQGSNGVPPLRSVDPSTLYERSVWDQHQYIVSTIDDLFHGDVAAILNPLTYVLQCFTKEPSKHLQCVYECFARFRESLDENYLESASNLIQRIRDVWDKGHPDYPDLGPWSQLTPDNSPSRTSWYAYRTVINTFDRYSDLKSMFDDIPEMRLCFRRLTKNSPQCLAVAISTFKKNANRQTL